MGPVTYDAWKCIGCRYCMVACPFQIPAYEYDNALTPKVMKCTLCSERTLDEGKPPACVEMCPRRGPGLRQARASCSSWRTSGSRENPGRYHPHVYGEHEVGGTSWLLLGDRPATELGMPELADQSPAELTETIQHGIFKGFTGPLMLFGLLSVLMKSSTDKRTAAGPDEDTTRTGRITMASHQHVDRGAARDAAGRQPAGAGRARRAHHEHAAPLFGRAAGAVLHPGRDRLAAARRRRPGRAGGLRFVFGLGAVTNLNDQYPWGIWIGIDVATGVALAAGGFTSAFIAHILHHERYHVLVRPALLTAMLGYTFVALGVCVDLGRYYNIWHVLMPSMWQGNSALFEVGMCVCCYLTVLYIEFLPIVCERFIGRVNLPGAAARPERRRSTTLLRIARQDAGQGHERSSSSWASCCPACTSRRWAR